MDYVVGLSKKLPEENVASVLPEQKNHRSAWHQAGPYIPLPDFLPQNLTKKGYIQKKKIIPYNKWCCKIASELLPGQGFLMNRMQPETKVLYLKQDKKSKSYIVAKSLKKKPDSSKT